MHILPAVKTFKASVRSGTKINSKRKEFCNKNTCDIPKVHGSVSYHKCEFFKVKG